MTPRHEALNLASPLIHNERQNIPHDIHLSLSDHVIYGHVPSGLYTRDIEHCECASVHKIPWQTHLGKRPPAWIVYEGVSGERERVGLSSGVRLALAAPPPGPIRVCFEPGGASDGDRRLLRRTNGRTDGRRSPRVRSSHLHHTHTYSTPPDGRTNGPSSSVPPFMTAVDRETEGRGARSSSVGYCSFPTAKITFKMDGWIDR